MAEATDTQLGEIKLLGDLNGDGGAQVGTNPQLTHLLTGSPGSSPGQYPVANITVDTKGRITAIEDTSSADIAALIPDATDSTPGIVKIGEHLYIQDTATAGIWTVDMGGSVSGGDSTGLANDACSSYTFTVEVDGGATQTVSVSGNDAQTFSDLIDEINDDLSGATASISGGDIVITSSTSGKLSSVEITSDSLFACLTGYDDLGSATDGVGACELYAKDATTLVAGVVQIGSGIDVTDGVISVDCGSLPVATTTSLGGVIVPTAGNIDVDGSGNISVPDASESVKGVMQVGSGLDVTAGVVSVDVSELSIPDASESVKGIMQVGTGLDVSSGVVSVDVSELSLPDATTGSKGVVQVGTNIDVASGVISVPSATSGSLGLVQVGDGLDVAAGVLSLHIATPTELGGVKVGSGLSIDGSGVLSATAVPDATYTTKGILQVTENTGLTLSSGVLSGTDATTGVKGVVQVGDNIDVTSGVISVPEATNTTYGVVRSGDTSRLTITAGEIDLASTVVVTNEANTFTKAQAVSPTTLTSGASVSVDASTSNVFKLTLAHNATLANPTNLTAGQTMMFVFTQGAGPYTLAFGSAYKFRAGQTPAISTGSGDVDLMTCISDGTNVFCSYNKDFA